MFNGAGIPGGIPPGAAYGANRIKQRGRDIDKTAAHPDIQVACNPVNDEKPQCGGNKQLNCPLFQKLLSCPLLYFAAYLIGYFIFSHDEVQNILEKIHVPMLCLALTGAVFYALYYQGTNFTSSECLQNILTNLYLWSAILAIMGCFKKYCNRETALTWYMTKSSFGIYILHYPVLISACYALHYFCKLPAI